MTGTRSLFNAFVKGFAEQLAGYGFERDKGMRIFRRSSRDGDVLIVELQSSTHSTREEKVFYINVALVLAPHWESERHRLGLPTSALPKSYDGIWRRRIGFTTLSGGDQWKFKDQSTLARVAEVARRRVDETMPELLRMLDRDALFVDATDLFKVRAWTVRAWLLAEKGTSEELEHLLSAVHPGAVRRIRQYLANQDPHTSQTGGPLPARTPSRHPSDSPSDHPRCAPNAEQAVSGWITEDNVVQLMKRISGYIAYAYDDLDEVALTGALDDTNDESADAWFRYPLIGMPPLTVYLARSLGSAVVSVRVEGNMGLILNTRIETLLDLL